MDPKNGPQDAVTLGESPNGEPIMKINLNTALEDELMGVPGFGPELARRIVAARPFESLSDLQRVSGIGPNVLERVRPYITLEDANSRPLLLGEEEAEAAEAEEMEAVAELVEGLTPVEDQPELEVEAQEEVTAEEEMDLEEELLAAEIEEDEAEVMEEPAPEPLREPVLAAPPRPEVAVAAERAPAITRGQMVWLALGSSFLAFVLALAVSLGVIASLNNGSLQFASPSQIGDLGRRMDGLVDQATTLQQDIGGLRGRLDNLETLGGRVEGVENMTTQLEAGMQTIDSDLQNAEVQISNLIDQAREITLQVDELQGQGEQFETFFSGLQDLLNQVFQPAEAP